jgi:hypothetical protein
MKKTAFLDVAPYLEVNFDRCFAPACCSHDQSDDGDSKYP